MDSAQLARLLLSGPELLILFWEGEGNWDLAWGGGGGMPEFLTLFLLTVTA